MQVKVTTDAGQFVVKALLYACPKTGNAPKDYSLTLNGAPAEVRLTGGGQHPRYCYVLIGGVSHYLPKNVIPVSGSNIEVVTDKPKAKEEPKAEVVTEEVKAEAKAKEEPKELKQTLNPKGPRAPRAPKAPKAA
jgi:hypothetical protein